MNYGKGFETEMRSDYLALEYIDAAELALQVCFEMGISEKAVKRAVILRRVPGRGEISERGGKYTVTERNPESQNCRSGERSGF